ncbi:uncharacterized protein B0I36DRAFT_357542 [Microdochium trichocladiopsis]|uniref:RRM domain-containing protein n=1 Tax=Microdochium trichocladiopsis TaxID=1682393 RepID=A0A9P8YH65_9PEZI|nr:uncharacterized protein B0I36DRAFT_357542 [Microdochium trichocladiopsis]KAH7040205.1 hypothetical protein B0I36DRAFT_357542 [Microdochium trichocladiopsis]
MAVSDSTSTSSSSDSLWVDRGILASTATRRDQGSQSSTSRSSSQRGDGDAGRKRRGRRDSSSPRTSKNSSRQTSRSQGDKPSTITTTSATHKPYNPFGSLYKPVTNHRAYRFGSHTDQRPDHRPAQRLALLKPAAEEECCGDPVVERSIAERRRVYLGSLAYGTEPTEIEAFVRKYGVAGGYVKMHISIDEFTGWNPGYCFLEFEDASAAARTLDLLDGKMLKGRPVRCSSCNPKGATLAGRRRGESEAAFRRWGDFVGGGADGDGPAAAASAELLGELRSGDDVPRGPQGPGQTLKYYQSRHEGVKRRLYVGGLPRMHDQAMAYNEMLKFFDGYQVVTASKRFSPAPVQAGNGRRNWQFVDFVSSEEAGAALEAKRCSRWRGAVVKLAWAKLKD